MRYTIKSRKHGNQDFWANAKEQQPGRVMSAYVFLEDKGPGTLGSQICEGGSFSGNTVTCNGTPEGLEKAARQWWRQHLRSERAMGL